MTFCLRTARRGRGTAVVLGAAMLGIFMASAPQASAATPIVGVISTGTPWPTTPQWQSLDETPTSSSVCPVSVVSTSGTVSGASGLLCGGAGGTTLTHASGGATPTIVLDYGKEVGGVPYFDVSAESGSPTLQAAYSESKTYISATGEPQAPWAEGDGHRYDDYTVTAAGAIVNQYEQGGERYEEITLTSTGSVTLSSVGIDYTADRTQASSLSGWFDSSNSEFNSIWYDSEYTNQLDSVPAKSLPSVWTVTGGALQTVPDNVGGDDIGLVSGGSSWGDYTTSFEAKVVANQAGWLVRSQDSNDGYVFILGDSTDTKGTVNTLQELYLHKGTYTSLGSVKLSSALTAGTWHAVSTTVVGSTLTVSLDGKRLASLAGSAYATGSVGFREGPGEEADFKDLTVTGSAGSSLFSDSLGSSSALSEFSPLPGVNSYASILDGARRDRSIWSGDMNVEIPTVFYSTDDSEYAKYSLEALGSYQLSSGFVTGALAPQRSLGTFTQTGTTGYYSASYSIYWVLDLADYYLYSGDLSFVDQELPVLEKELAWNATQVDSRGLITTTSSDDADWDFYDVGKPGEVTEYNMLYYKALLDGATMATAAGATSQAATYTGEAAALKTAINAHLYNSGTGLYYLSNQDTSTIAQDANSLAVLYGVAPASDDSKILAMLKSDLWKTSYGPKPFSGSSYADIVSTYITGYELDARLAQNDASDAETLLNQVWGHIISSSGFQTGTMWENINGSTGQPGRGSSTSLAHGWSATPVSALSGYVLGIQPATAGYATWTVKPNPGDVSWSEGSVPTPHGAISVDWAGKSGVGQFSMRVTAPSGTSGTIAVPTFGASNPVVEVNGRSVWSGGTFSAAAGITGAYASGGYVYLTGVQPGIYTIGSNPGNYGAPAGYTSCAAEGATCTVSGTKSVAYGANGIYTYATESSSVTCSSPGLSDADYGMTRSCYVGSVVSGPSGVSTAYCGSEASLCSFSGSKTVYFGAGGKWTSKTISGGTPCTTAVFGDPDSGVAKSCFIAS
jgi:alpha-L-rhamnosidase